MLVCILMLVCCCCCCCFCLVWRKRRRKALRKAKERLPKDISAIQHVRDEEAQLWWDKASIHGAEPGKFDPSADTAHSIAVAAAARAASKVAEMEAAARAAAATLAVAPVLAAALKVSEESQNPDH